MNTEIIIHFSSEYAGKAIRKLDYEPQTYNINGDLLLVFETENGTLCGVQPDLIDDLYCTAEGFYDYGEPDTQAVKELWTLLGIEQWPDSSLFLQ